MESIVKTYTGLRNEALMSNNGKYRLYRTEMDAPIGSQYDIYANEKKRPESVESMGILDYTFNTENGFGRELNERYGRDVEELDVYSVKGSKPSFRVNNYEGLGDYLTYVSSVYGKEEHYFQYLPNLVKYRDGSINFDIVPNSEGKVFSDYINDILQYSDVKYLLEKESVGIVKDIDVALALSGVITTNKNNFSGKDTRLGTISNSLYARTLQYGAQFNSLRRTNYITEGLDSLYGNNLSNIYHLSSLFTIDPEKGRFADFDSGEYIQEVDMSIDEYQKQMNPEYEVIKGAESKYNKGETYYDVKKDEEGMWNITEENIDFSDIHYNEIGDNETFSFGRENNLLHKTNKLFEEGRIKSLINRTKDEKYSRGRALKGTKRVWTYSNQYKDMKDLMRPFTKDGDFINVNELQKDWKVFRTVDGADRLNRYSSIYKNGMVNITPLQENDDVDLKRCMFSIENLAWKDINVTGKGSYRIDSKNGEKILTDSQNILSKDQIGPNGGRIMWFPPYDIEFSENINVDWADNKFIGRGEPIYTYTNTQRTGTLNFTLLVDHPSILDYWGIDKNDGKDEYDESILKHFTGEELLKVNSKTVNNLLNPNKSEGGNCEVSGEFPEEDIVFYTFRNEDTTTIDKIFGGTEGLTLFGETTEGLKLGYEMNTNPYNMGCNVFVDSENYELKKVLGLDDVEKNPEEWEDVETKEVADLDVDFYTNKISKYNDCYENENCDSGILTDVREKLNSETRYNKVSSKIYFYKNSDGKYVTVGSAKEAVKQYCDNGGITKIETLPEAIKNCNIFNTYECYSKYCQVECGNSLAYVESFSNKREFKNSDYIIGTYYKGKDIIYCYRLDKEYQEFKDEEKFNDFLLNKGQKFTNKSSFMDSSEIFGVIDNEVYIKYLQVISGTISLHLDNLLGDDEEMIIKKYFLSSDSKAVNGLRPEGPYGALQCHFIMGPKEVNVEYESIQDFIIESDIPNKGKTVDGKLMTTGMLKGTAKVIVGTIEEDVTKGYTAFNSTYKLVKGIYPNATCSFGEFYVALKEKTDGPLTQYLLSCEESVLKNLSGATEESVKSEIEDIKRRISYIRTVLHSENSVVKKIKTKNGYETYTEIRSLNQTLNSADYEDMGGNTDEGYDITLIVVGNGIDEKNYELINSLNKETATDYSRYNELQEEHKRYDEEYLFFKHLQNNDSFAYQKLIDKIKYFSPAYHSMSPEGFNARLTFLHQCTRQGPTETSSDIDTVSTASNLAFGRPPFCVLRLGDFLNTKVVIKGINISYPDTLWDLNTEGIGAQFMMAKVSMSLDILGGSDIAAPVKRLQNAVSFNYYANTSVYDNRSDVVEYDGKGGIREVRTWKPQMNGTIAGPDPVRNN